MNLFRKHLPNLMIYLVSVVILGLAQLLEAQFDFSLLTSSRFIFDVAIPSIINLMILFNTIFLYKRIKKEREPGVIDKKKTIFDIFKSSVDVDLSVFLFKIKNRKKKIDAYKSQIQKKIDKLNFKASTDDLIIFNGDSEEDKKHNKYCLRMQQLINLLDDNYIEKNINFLSVKYKPIKESELRNGYRSKMESDDDFEDLDKAIFIDILPNYIYSFLFMSFFSSFILRPKEISLVMILTFFVKLLTGLLNFWNGKNYVENVWVNKLLENLDKTIKILTEYLHWKINKRGDKNE